MFLAALAAIAISGHRVRLVAVGDIMLGRYVGRRIERESVDSPFASVSPALRKSDLAVGNLECAITTAPFAIRKPILLRAAVSAVPGLRHAGFGVLSLANNHAGDCGPAGIAEASSRLRSAGVSPLGPSTAPVIVNRNGLRIGFIGFCDLPPGSGLDAAVRALRPKVDVVIVMIHWGIEGSLRESSEQRALAQRLAADGVDLILGSHPHVLEPIRWIAGRRRCLVAFSLGNFVFDARPGAERRSEILSVTLGPAGVTGYSTKPVLITNGYPLLVNLGA